MPQKRPINVFISYSNHKKDRPLLLELKKYLNSIPNRPLNIWEDGLIIPGTPWDQKIKDKLLKADLILLLISVDFINSDYIKCTELPLAFKQRDEGSCEIVPIYLRECPYKGHDFSEWGMIPSMPHRDKQLVPVTSERWNSKDKAFTAVVSQLEKTFEIIEKTPKREDNKIELLSSWDQFFTDNPPITKKNSLLLTVDCNRETPYKNEIKDHFDNNHNKPKNLVYFISACKTQKPESLAKRLIYEYNKDAKGETLFTTLHCNTQGELEVLNMEFGPTPEATWEYFKHMLEEKLLLGDLKEKITFEKLQKKECFKKVKKLAFIFRVLEKNWNSKHVNIHINFILEKISIIHEKNRKFALFFIFNFRGLHHSCTETYERSLVSLDNTLKTVEDVVNGFNPLHIKQLSRVSKADIKTWSEEIIDIRHINSVLEALKNRNLESDPEVPIEPNKFDMEIVEEMQYAAYTHIRDKY